MKQSRAKGFTLTEVVLAIGVVAVLIVVFMAMFIPARRTVQSALTIREADRIVHALTAELGELRNSERAAPNARKSSTTRYISAFDKAFYWMQFTSKPATIFAVRMTQLVVERMDSNAYGYKLAPKYGTIYNPYNRGKVITEPSLYVYTPEKGGGLNLPWGAEVLYQAEFFQLLNTDPERLHLTWENLKTPIFTRNLAFRR